VLCVFPDVCAGVPLASHQGGTHRDKEISQGANFSITIINKLVLRIRIRRIHMFLDLLDPDPRVRGTDPDPSIINQK
jgi:hypothetical protein